MPEVPIQVPVLVKKATQDKESSYVISPVFLPYPVIEEARYSEAISEFKKQFREIYYHFSSVEDKLLWPFFKPDLSLEQSVQKFRLGKQLINGSFNLVRFQVQGKEFVCLPDLFQYTFMVNPDLPFSSQLEDVLKYLLQEFALEIDEAGLESYYSGRKDTIKWIPVVLSVQHLPFSFDQATEDSFMATFRVTTAFDGGSELRRLGKDLNQNFPEGFSRAFEIDASVQEARKLLFGSNRTPVALLGEAGTGRHALLLESLFRELETYSAENLWRATPVWYLDPPRIISGMSIVGHWEKRFEAILHHLSGENENRQKCILVIDKPVSLMKIGRSASSDLTLSKVLKPFLEARKFQLVLLATPEEWKILQDLDRSFSDLFFLKRINQPDANTMLAILLKKRKWLETNTKVRFTLQALDKLQSIHRSFFAWKALPGGVLDLMVQLASKYPRQEIDASQVVEAFTKNTGLAPLYHQQSQNLEHDKITREVHQKLIGQERAAEALVQTLHLIKSRLKDPSRPVASFLFIGPTGVGKTQAAKLLAQMLFPKQEGLLRFDMNEYLDGSAANRLIGYGDGVPGQLTSKVLFQPFGVVLLDEIEKAHPRVLDILLQVLDDGRLTDGNGKTIDFSNTIIVMTSNLGAQEASQKLGFGADNQDDTQVYEKAVRNFFRPEFINRIDQTIVFKSLEFDQIMQIAKLQIDELLTRDGFRRRNTILNISDEVLEWVARRGFHKQMGGRAMKRQIERDLTALSADRLIQTQTQHPIIFEIKLEREELKTEITELKFVDSLPPGSFPQLPEDHQVKGFLKKLIQILDKLEHTLGKMESGDKPTAIVISDTHSKVSDWQFHVLKSRVRGKKDHLNNLLLAFGDHRVVRPSNMAVRLKKAPLSSENIDSKAYRQHIRDKIFQQEGIDELQENNKFSRELYDSLESEMIENWIDTKMLEIFTSAVKKDQPESLQLVLESPIKNKGLKSLNSLKRLYTTLWNALEIQYTELHPFQFRLEGYGLKILFSGEEGMHLFFDNASSIQPVRVRLGKERKSKAGKAIRIIRAYYEEGFMMDFRTGLTNPIFASILEIKFLVICGVHPTLLKSQVYGETAKKQ